MSPPPTRDESVVAYVFSPAPGKRQELLQTLQEIARKFDQSERMTSFNVLRQQQFVFIIDVRFAAAGR